MCWPLRNVLEISISFMFVYARLSAKSAPTLNWRRLFSCIQSLIHGKKKRKARKRRFGNNKKRKIEKFGKKLPLKKGVATFNHYNKYVYMDFFPICSMLFRLNSLLLGRWRERRKTAASSTAAKEEA